jgi:nitroreductase
MNMLNIMYEIDKRRAYRAFSGEKATGRQIERIMAAAHLAPSCFNKQPWRFILYKEPDDLERISSTIVEKNSWAKKAAFIVAAVTRDEDDCMLSDNRNYALFDTGLAVESMMLQAVHEGLYVHPMAGFKPEKVREISGVPEEYTVITVIAFGVPGNIEGLSDELQKREAAPRQRKPLDEVVFEGVWKA